MDFFLHRYNNIFSSPYNNMLANPSSTDPPAYKKNHSKIFLYPTDELFQLARNTDITKKNNNYNYN